ncbi:MAG: hypothetical protein NDI75_15020 [Candidatus Didemnitutus sp.]|nr:hypothetical protein [Candidatus Didemnitutus sp.]
MSEQFLTRGDGSLWPDLASVPATAEGQNAKNAVDFNTRALLVKVVPDGGSAADEATSTSFSKTVAASGTPEKLTATDYYVDQIVIVPLRTNTGLVYLGFTSGNDEQQVEVGTAVVLKAPPGKKLNPAKIYADVTVNGEGVRVILID